MTKQILLINDLPGYGKVALSAMIPVLSHMGHHLYNLPTALVSNTSDYSVPNYTEATCLAGLEYLEGGLTESQAEKLIRNLIQAGAKSIAVTSAKVNGQDCVIVYDSVAETIDYLPFDYIPVRFPGTGDIFSAIFMGNILKGLDLITSTRRAMDNVRTMLDANRDNEDKYKGIPVESCLEVLDR